MRRHVLNANALYRFLNGDEGAQIGVELFNSAGVAGTTVMMSVLNRSEVYDTLVTA